MILTNITLKEGQASNGQNLQGKKPLNGTINVIGQRGNVLREMIIVRYWGKRALTCTVWLHGFDGSWRSGTAKSRNSDRVQLLGAALLSAGVESDGFDLGMREAVEALNDIASLLGSENSIVISNEVGL